jgi:hypothetical protein
MVKAFLYSIKHHTMKKYEEVDTLLHSFSASLDAGELIASCPTYFNPKERDPPRTQWVGTRAGMDVAKRKFCALALALEVAA